MERKSYIVCKNKTQAKTVINIAGKLGHKGLTIDDLVWSWPLAIFINPDNNMSYSGANYASCTNHPEITMNDLYNALHNPRPTQADHVMESTRGLDFGCQQKEVEIIVKNILDYIDLRLKEKE